MVHISHSLITIYTLHRRTVALIFVSWAAAPLITGIFGALFFWFIRRFVLRSSNPYQQSVDIYPIAIFLAISLDLFMVLYKAGKNNAQIKGARVSATSCLWDIGRACVGVLLCAWTQPSLTMRMVVDGGVEISGVEEAIPANEDEKCIEKSEQTNKICLESQQHQRR